MQDFYEVNDKDLSDVTGGFIKSEQYDENGMPYVSKGRFCPAWTCTCGNRSLHEVKMGPLVLFAGNP